MSWWLHCSSTGEWRLNTSLCPEGPDKAQANLENKTKKTKKAQLSLFLNLMQALKSNLMIFCNRLARKCLYRRQSVSGLLKWPQVTANKFILTFPRTAVLCAGSEVLEAVQIALAATVKKGLTLHGGHVEEVAVK